MDPETGPMRPSWLTAFSIGLIAKDTGEIRDVHLNSPAFQAGIAPATKIIAVNGRQFSPSGLREAVAGAVKNPNPIELVENIAGPVLGNYGAEDMRINAHLDELVKAMVTYKKDFEMRIYPNAAHAFFNDTIPMYNEAAAKDAWERVLRFFKRTLEEA